MKETTIENKTKLILDLLKTKDSSTTEISRTIELDYYKTIELLELLEKQKLIEKTELNGYTFWKKLSVKGGVK